MENQLKEQKAQLDELRGYAKEVARQRSFFEHPVDFDKDEWFSCFHNPDSKKNNKPDFEIFKLNS